MGGPDPLPPPPPSGSTHAYLGVEFSNILTFNDHIYNITTCKNPHQFSDFSKGTCVDLLCFFVLCLLCLCARLFICALWSPAGKGLTSWLSFVVYNCEFPVGILGQVWYLIVSIPDLCTLTYFEILPTKSERKSLCQFSTTEVRIYITDLEFSSENTSKTNTISSHNLSNVTETIIN